MQKAATVQRHECPGCDTKLVTEGEGKQAKSVAKHVCIMGAPMMATNRFGEPGHGFVFAGGMDAIMLTNLNVNLNTNNQNTVCLWMRWDGGVNGATNPVAMPFGWGNTNQDYCLLFQREGNGRFGFSGGMADVYGTDYGSVFSNHWVHVAAVFNNGNMMNSGLYINGQRTTGSMMTDWQFPMQFSSDLAHWTNYSDMFMSSAGTMVRTVALAGPHMFWRLQANP